MSRKKVDSKTQLEVLEKSRRRCCLCAFLEHDLEEQRGQIAHLDQDSANSDLENLAFLCLRHHDDYDSQTSQSKGLTVEEVKRYRSMLHAVMEKRDEAIYFSPTKIGDLNVAPQLSSGVLLGRVIEIRDRELQSGSLTNGIALRNLASIAATEAGDFKVCEEAFLSLLRLAGKTPNNIPSLSPPVTTASTVLEASSVIRILYSTDWNLTNQTLRHAYFLSTLGGKRFQDIDVQTHQVPTEFLAFCQILCKAGRVEFSNDSKWAAKLIGQTLGNLLMFSARLLNSQEVKVPQHPGIIYRSLSGRERAIHPDDDPLTDPFVWAANRLAMLSTEAYDSALKSLVYRIGVNSVGTMVEHAESFKKLELALFRWHALPSDAIGIFHAKTNEEAERANSLLDELKERGIQVAASVRAFVETERQLLIAQGGKTDVSSLV